VQELATHAGIYTTAYFLGTGSLESLTISYSVDSRGRVLSEISKGEDGKTIGELRNTWLNDRLQDVEWKSGDDERRIEFEYDRDGNPMAERNYRKGVLERTVTIDGYNEIEEIYMNGVLILRAYWENGLKISEERVR
jgi:antitoxin component YwqK of YwqJK toxin-antitoxin module